jgi:hypothetical protein
MFWRGILLVLIVLATGVHTSNADDLGLAIGMGKFSKAELDQSRPLHMLSLSYTPCPAVVTSLYPEFVVGCWNAKAPVYSFMSDASPILDYIDPPESRKWTGIYSGFRMVADDERRARRQDLSVWPAIGIGGIAQWANPREGRKGPLYRAMGFLRINVLIEHNAIMFLELEGQTNFENHFGTQDPGIEAVLKLGHRFRAF